MVDVKAAPEEVNIAPEGLLLRRAQAWEEQGQCFQAIAMYLRLMRYHPRTEEAQRARGRLFELAQQMEASGKVHQAIHLYERLTTLR